MITLPSARRPAFAALTASAPGKKHGAGSLSDFDPTFHPRLSIKHTLTAHLSDPTHRFHAPGGLRDFRPAVSSGGMLQRLRGRRFG